MLKSSNMDRDVSTTSRENVNQNKNYSYEKFINIICHTKSLHEVVKTQKKRPRLTAQIN